jgi:hypothetical protein
MNKLYCYEIDALGGRWWEVYDDNDDVEQQYISTVEPDEFGGWLANARTLGYDVYINTYESWEAMDEFLSDDISH